MNILFLTFSMLSGGTEHLTVDICNELVNRKHNVHLYIVNEHYDEEVLSKLDEKVIVIKQNRREASGNKLVTIKKVSEYIKDKKIKIVHCNNPTAPDLLLLKPFLFPKVKIIQTIHDTMGYRKMPLHKVYFRNIQIHKFIAISNSVRNDMVLHGANKNKIEVIYNGIKIKKYSPCYQAKSSSKFIIGNVARINPCQKRQDLLIMAMAKVKKVYPNIECRFAGMVSKDQQKEFELLKGLVKKHNLDENIKFCGNVLDIPKFLDDLDLFVLPSRTEGFGLSLVEAMAMGVPVIASNIEGPSEVIGNNARGLLFKTGDLDSLVENILYAIKNINHIKEKSSEIRDYVITNFDISQTVDRLETIYVSVGGEFE